MHTQVQKDIKSSIEPPNNTSNSLEQDYKEGAETRSVMALEFNGKAQEYFRIWIVNLCLTLLSLGIFSAWAKVRKKRYLYSSLSLDGTPFQYLGLPLPILRGRIIAAVMFLIYYLSSNLFTPLLPYILAVGLVLAPWVFVQSVAFNFRYTAFRNITFRFTSSYTEAFKVLSAWGLIPVFIVGIIFDFWGYWWIAAVVSVLLGLLFPYWLRGIKNYIVTRTCYGGVFGQFGATGGEFFQVYFLAGLILSGAGVVTAILVGLSSLTEKNIQLISIIVMIVSYAGYIVAFAYIHASITNSVWNQLKLGPIRFRCTLSSMDMAKLYLTNAIGIVISLGFLLPWAVIRTIQYRVEHTQVQAVGELTEFHADPEHEVNAVGAELTDVFDMDLSI